MIGRRNFVILSSASLALSACGVTATPTPREAETMGPRLAQFKTIIEAWKRKDVEAVLDMLSDDLVWHYAAAIAPPVYGKDGARAFLERFGKDIGEVNWRIFHAAETQDRLFVEGVDEYITTDGVSVAAPYAGIIEFKGDKIVGWRDYIDRATVDAMKAGNPYPAQVEQLIDRPAI
jgi:limonene-1,2-epoxide hydrolase